MKVFVSHSTHDRWVASRIAKDLNELGAETFLDEKDIETGDSISEAVSTNLKNSDEFMVLVTPASVNSQWVLVEMGGALILGLRIVPIVMHLSKNELPKVVSDNLARDINEIDKYYDELKTRLAGGGAPPPPRPRPRATPARMRRARRTFDIGDQVRINPSAAAKRNTNLVVEWDEYDHGAWEGEETEVMFVDTDRTAKLDVDGEENWWAFEWLELVE